MQKWRGLPFIRKYGVGLCHIKGGGEYYQSKGTLEVSLKQLLVTRILQILFIHMDSARMAVRVVKMGVETVLQIVGHQ